MPRLSDVKETCLYVDDLQRALEFYVTVLGLSILVQDDRFCALDIQSKHVLLLFVRDASNKVSHLPGGTIPPHNGAGPLHIGFAIDREQLQEWESHLTKHGVEILSRVTWPKGGRSLYFRDPDGHLLELLTPGVWASY